MQSDGRQWMMKINKIDMHAIVSPTVWSQLRSSFFKGGARLLAAVNGSMWSGTTRTQYHIRTLFEDTPHGSEMQISTILLNLLDAAERENRLPEEFVVGSDNTPKEMKNKFSVFCYGLAAVPQYHAWLVVVELAFDEPAGRPHARRS